MEILSIASTFLALIPIAAAVAATAAAERAVSTKLAVGRGWYKRNDFMGRILRISYLIFFFCLHPLIAHQTFDLAQWSYPILYGSQPTLFGKKLYINDQFDSKIKVYDVAKGFDNPDFLWETPGPGQGPGEIPGGAFINNLAIDPESGELWISHQFGYTRFDENGKFIKQIKMRYNRSYLTVHGNHWCMTSFDHLRRRKIMTYVQVGVERPLWEIDNEKGIPVTNNGSFIDSNQELLYQDGFFLYYDSSIGELVVADLKGDIQLLVYLKQYFMENFKPVNFDGVFNYGQDALKTAGIPYAYSGMVKEGSKITLLRLAYSGGVVTEKGETKVARYENGNFKPIKIITEVSLETGAITAEYFHPVSLQWLYLLALEENQLLFFDMETGDKLYRVKKSELQSIKKILF